MLIRFLQEPWPWYVAGPLIGLTVPLLLWLGNKPFGLSSNLRHICAACIPARKPFFKYNWKKERWNLVFVSGCLIGGFVGGILLPNPDSVSLHPEIIQYLQQFQIRVSGINPGDLFSWQAITSTRSLILLIAGGFLVGFGTRYAGGCTSGHSITGLSNLQWPSLVATACFMAGGFIMTRFILPLLLQL